MKDPKTSSTRGARRDVARSVAKAPVTPPSQPDGSEPLLPHERDQKADATDGEPSERVRKGAKDLQRGVEDTSRSIEADRAYRDLKKR